MVNNLWIAYVAAAFVVNAVAPRSARLTMHIPSKWPWYWQYIGCLRLPGRCHEPPEARVAL